MTRSVNSTPTPPPPTSFPPSHPHRISRAGSTLRSLVNELAALDQEMDDTPSDSLAALQAREPALVTGTLLHLTSTNGGGPVWKRRLLALTSDAHLYLFRPHGGAAVACLCVREAGRVDGVQGLWRVEGRNGDAWTFKSADSEGVHYWELVVRNVAVAHEESSCGKASGVGGCTRKGSSESMVEAEEVQRCSQSSDANVNTVWRVSRQKVMGQEMGRSKSLAAMGGVSRGCSSKNSVGFMSHEVSTKCDSEDRAKRSVSFELERDASIFRSIPMQQHPQQRPIIKNSLNSFDGSKKARWLGFFRQ
ncbi:hypothetical protein BC830DRAFT_1094442 [Chytriomyces sp. MP71]|nr:hypothetical protein BC830DRAFT_1094442 [Chytriomyces sp. MP71]